MRKIAIDMTPFNKGISKGGIGRTLECLVPELVGQDIGKYYFFKRKNVAIPALNTLHAETINIEFINTIFWQQVQLPFYLYKLGVDALFSTYEILPIIKPEKVKCATYIYEDPFHRYKIALEKGRLSPYARLSFAYINALSKSSFYKTDFIAVASRATFREMNNRYKFRGRIEVLHPGINNIFKKIPEAEFVNNTLSKYNIKPHYIFSLSSDDPRNNTESVIVAFSELKKRDYEGCLILGGCISDDTRKRFMETAEKNNCRQSVKIIGYIDDINEVACLYHACDLYIDLPIFEGFGLQVVEAAALGVPIVCSDIAPLNENIRNSALFVNPTDINKITASMDRILNDGPLRNKLRERHREIRNEFDWNKVASRLNRYFNE